MIMKRLLLLTILTFFTCLSSLIAQNDLEVVKGRNARSATENGALFSLEITNNSSSSKEYVISTKQLDTPCDASRMKSYNANLDLDIQVVDTQRSALSLPAGASKIFQIKVSTRKDTPYNVWSCIEVMATTSSSTKSSTALLKVYVPDPSEG